MRSGMPFASSANSPAIGCKNDVRSTGFLGPGMTFSSSWYWMRVRSSGLNHSEVAVTGPSLKPISRQNWQPSVPQFIITNGPPSSSPLSR